MYYYLYFSKKAMADAVKVTLQNEGFQVKVRPAPYPWWKRIFVKYPWSCLAEKTFVPAEAMVIETSQRMNALAAKYQGEFDGWEAKIIR